MGSGRGGWDGGMHVARDRQVVTSFQQRRQWHFTVNMADMFKYYSVSSVCSSGEARPHDLTWSSISEMRGEMTTQGLPASSGGT